MEAGRMMGKWGLLLHVTWAFSLSRYGHGLLLCLGVQVPYLWVLVFCGSFVVGAQELDWSTGGVN